MKYNMANNEIENYESFNSDVPFNIIIPIISYLLNNEIFFDKEDEIAAEKEIERLAVKKQDNFYDYYV